MKLDKCLDMQERARIRIPGMTQLLSKRPDQFSSGVWPGYFDRAEGVRIWDLDGNEYIDMSIGGIGATILGYADPDVDKAVMAAIRKGVASSLNCPEEVELAELLCELHPWAEMVRFSRSGGEAMAIAVRIARAATGRDKVAVCGYHGWHDWYLAANLGTEDALGNHLLSGLSPVGVPRSLTGTVHTFRYNRLDELKAVVAEHGSDLAAIIMEPIRNFEPEPGFLAGVRTVADQLGAVLVFDEISAGFRLCAGGAHLLYGVEPDLAVFSKALGNGYPIAAVIGRAVIMQAAQRTFISSTNWTERIGSVAALATLKKFIRENVQTRLAIVGAAVQKGWESLSVRHGLHISVHGMKPLGHFTFEYKEALEMKAYFIQCMLKRGYLASNMFYAMSAHTLKDVEGYLGAADESYALLSDALDKNDLSEKLEGQPSVAGFKRIA